jgi:hypothetical protein
MTTEEMIASAVAVVVKQYVSDQLGPLRARIIELETEAIAMRQQIKALAYQSAPSRPPKSIPFGPAPRISRSGKDAH